MQEVIGQAVHLVVGSGAAVTLGLLYIYWRFR